MEATLALTLSERSAIERAEMDDSSEVRDTVGSNGRTTLIGSILCCLSWTWSFADFFSSQYFSLEALIGFSFLSQSIVIHGFFPAIPITELKGVVPVVLA